MKSYSHYFMMSNRFLLKFDTLTGETPEVLRFMCYDFRQVMIAFLYRFFQSIPYCDHKRTVGVEILLAYIRHK